MFYSISNQPIPRLWLSKSLKLRSTYPKTAALPWIKRIYTSSTSYPIEASCLHSVPYVPTGTQNRPIAKRKVDILVKTVFLWLSVHSQIPLSSKRQVFPNKQSSSTVVQRAKGPIGLSISLNVGRLWVRKHGSRPGYSRKENLHSWEMALQTSLEGRNTFGVTSLLSTFLNWHRMKGRHILEIFDFYLQVCIQ